MQPPITSLLSSFGTGWSTGPQRFGPHSAGSETNQVQAATYRGSSTHRCLSDCGLDAAKCDCPRCCKPALKGRSVAPCHPCLGRRVDIRPWCFCRFRSFLGAGVGVGGGMVATSFTSCMAAAAAAQRHGLLLLFVPSSAHSRCFVLFGLLTPFA